MKRLPFGLGDSEIDKFLEEDLDFTNNGDVNYMNLISMERFKRTKYVYESKRNMALGKTFEYKSVEDLAGDKTSRRSSLAGGRSAKKESSAGGNYEGI